MAACGKSAEQWRIEGNQFCRAKDFEQAVWCYDQALGQTTEESDSVILVLNRCHALLSMQDFDGVLHDAKVVLEISPGNEKALFRMAKALYGLRRFKESVDRFSMVIKLYPKNQEAVHNLEVCLERLREECGRINLASMLDEAISKFPAPDMDRADCIGSIEIRPSAITSHGRGIFSTKAIQAGELLLVEKAFCSAYVHTRVSGSTPNETTSPWRTRSVSELQIAIVKSLFVKLQVNPSLNAAVADLYSGPDTIEKTGKDEDLMAQLSFVKKRLFYNNFTFPILPKDWHWRDPSVALLEKLEHVALSSIGMWLKASYTNHACYPAVQGSYIGDMMIWRAYKDIAPDTELGICYIERAQNYSDRQEALRKFGFTCECIICSSEMATPLKKIKDRDVIIRNIMECLRKPVPKDIEPYIALIDQMASTYIFPPSQEPRRRLIEPITNFMVVCKANNMLTASFKLGVILLQSLGFELDVTPTSWRIMSWGYMGGNDVLPVLCEMWQTSRIIQPRLYEGLERDLKTAYTILTGEAESFEGMYGSLRSKVLEENLKTTEAMDMQEKVNAMIKEMRLRE